MILTIVKVMGTDGLVRQGAMMCWNQNIAGQDTKANTIASDFVAVAPSVLVINTLLIEHKDLFILHSQYHGCRWLGNTVIQFCHFSIKKLVKIQIYHYVFKMNPPQQEIWILCLPCTSINSTDYTCKCILFLNNWFEIIIFLLMISIYKY